MRLYITYSQLALASQLLLDRDLPCLVVQDAFLLGTISCDERSWGCVMSAVCGPKDAEWLLQAWNKTGNLVEAAVIEAGHLKFLIACPEWAKDDASVKTLIQKLIL